MADPAFLPQKAALIMTLRGQGIRSTEVLSAIEQVPREMFLPEILRQHAYDNASLPISQGQTISQPYIVARMTEALELTGRERVLEIGTGSGYQAAVLALLCRRVYSIERLRPLLVEAERLLTSLKITNLTTRHGDGGEGWPEAAPFDRIIMTCAAPARPSVLVKQLKPGGIMIAPVDTEKGHQKIRRYQVDENGNCHEKDIVDARFVPLVTNVDIDP